ncbi:MAG: hypothetical protein HRT35_35140 [Algicola sp.]|nr:hypothetical protein [Algicola sp.]
MYVKLTAISSALSLAAVMTLATAATANATPSPAAFEGVSAKLVLPLADFHFDINRIVSRKAKNANARVVITQVVQDACDQCHRPETP